VNSFVCRKVRSLDNEEGVEVAGDMMAFDDGFDLGRAFLKSLAVFLGATRDQGALVATGFPRFERRHS
jgi:hypothetical protein